MTRILIWISVVAMVGAGLPGQGHNHDHPTPAGPPSEVTTISFSADEFTSDFNDKVDRTRLVLVFSPT